MSVKQFKYKIFVTTNDKTFVYSTDDYKLIDKIWVEFFDHKKQTTKRVPLSNVEVEVLQDGN